MSIDSLALPHHALAVDCRWQHHTFLLVVLCGFSRSFFSFSLSFCVLFSSFWSWSPLSSSFNLGKKNNKAITQLRRFLTKRRQFPAPKLLRGTGATRVWKPTLDNPHSKNYVSFHTHHRYLGHALLSRTEPRTSFLEQTQAVCSRYWSAPGNPSYWLGFPAIQGADMKTCHCNSADSRPPRSPRPPAQHPAPHRSLRPPQSQPRAGKDERQAGPRGGPGLPGAGPPAAPRPQPWAPRPLRAGPGPGCRDRAARSPVTHRVSPAQRRGSGGRRRRGSGPCRARSGDGPGGSGVTLTRRICCSSSLAAAATPVRLSDFRPAESARQTLPPLPAARPYPLTFPPGAGTQRTEKGRRCRERSLRAAPPFWVWRGVAAADDRARVTDYS